MSKKIVIGVFGIVLKRGKFLIMRRRADDTLPRCWDLPGGKVEIGENYHEALLREVKEESNLKVEVICPVDLYNAEAVEYPKTRFFAVTYVCQFKSGHVKLSEDHTEYVWTDLKSFHKYRKQMTPGGRQAISSFRRIKKYV